MVHSLNGVLILYSCKKEHRRPLWIYLLWISRIYCQVKNRKYQWISKTIILLCNKQEEKRKYRCICSSVQNKERMDKPQTNK